MKLDMIIILLIACSQRYALIILRRASSDIKLLTNTLLNIKLLTNGKAETADRLINRASTRPRFSKLFCLISDSDCFIKRTLNSEIMEGRDFIIYYFFLLFFLHLLTVIVSST